MEEHFYHKYYTNDMVYTTLLKKIEEEIQENIYNYTEEKYFQR